MDINYQYFRRRRKFVTRKFWERLIGQTKTTQKKILGRAHIILQGLQTIIVEVEAVLNDRPITYVSSDVDYPVPLTPSHLLCGRRITRLSLPTFEEDEMHHLNFDDSLVIKRRVTRQSMILQHFWSRWRHD